MSSSSSATAPGSRSSSPATPEPVESVESIAIQSLENLTWYHNAHSPKTLQPILSWDMDSGALMVDSAKCEDNQMLRLDELLEQHAYEECVTILIS